MEKKEQEDISTDKEVTEIIEETEVPVLKNQQNLENEAPKGTLFERFFKNKTE